MSLYLARGDAFTAALPFNDFFFRSDSGNNEFVYLHGDHMYLNGRNAQVIDGPSYNIDADPI